MSMRENIYIYIYKPNYIYNLIKELKLGTLKKRTNDSDPKLPS